MMAALIKTLAGYVDTSPDWLKALYVVLLVILTAVQAISGLLSIALWATKKYYHL